MSDVAEHGGEASGGPARADERHGFDAELGDSAFDDAADEVRRGAVRDEDAPHGPRIRRIVSPRGKQRGAPIVRKGTVRLQHDVARRVRAGHPWIYREAIGRPLRGKPGDPIELVDWDGEFVGRGIFDGDSAITVRMMTRDPYQEVDDALVTARVQSAVALRRQLLDLTELECMRMVNAEADGLPAIAVDRYGEYLVVQLYTPAVVRFCDALYGALEAELSPRAIYEQRRFRSLAGEAPKGAELVRGAPAPVELTVKEGPLSFYVDVTAPLSAGLFPDLREGRQTVARLAKGERVLNLFSYTGAISVYAAYGGASSVTAVDVAAKAHARARRNFALNGFDGEAPDHIAGDALKALARLADRGELFGMVVIDPPAFASASKGGRAWSAARDYRDLVAASLAVLEPRGVLVAVSSMRKLSHGDFDLALGEGAALAGTTLRIVERRGLPADFPTTPGFLDGNYLKLAVAIRD